jgi:hypothetical protein
MGIKAYDVYGEWAELENGYRFYPIPREECDTKCRKEAINTVFIGSDPNQDWGMAFYKSGAEVEEEQSVTTSLDSSSGTLSVISIIVIGMSVFAFLLIV